MKTIANEVKQTNLKIETFKCGYLVFNLQFFLEFGIHLLSVDCLIQVICENLKPLVFECPIMKFHIVNGYHKSRSRNSAAHFRDIKVHIFASLPKLFRVLGVFQPVLFKVFDLFAFRSFRM